jgi:hypothetical protein
VGNAGLGLGLAVGVFASELVGVCSGVLVLAAEGARVGAACAVAVDTPAGVAAVTRAVTGFWLAGKVACVVWPVQPARVMATNRAKKRTDL